MTVEPRSTDDEIAMNLRLLRTPIGAPWSGRTRYAAAMFFHQRGDMSDEALEVFRVLSRLDSEDPARLLRASGVDMSSFELGLLRAGSVGHR